MAKTLQERVDYAISQLVERTVPVYPDEDDESTEQRLDDAYHFARELLGR
jgi:gamma-tubulin complex component 3